MFAIQKNTKLENRLILMKQYYDNCDLEIVTEYDFLVAVPDLKAGDILAFSKKYMLDSSLKTLQDLISINEIEVDEVEIAEANHRALLDKPIKKKGFWNRLLNIGKNV